MADGSLEDIREFQLTIHLGKTSFSPKTLLLQNPYFQPRFQKEDGDSSQMDTYSDLSAAVPPSAAAVLSNLSATNGAGGGGGGGGGAKKQKIIPLEEKVKIIKRVDENSPRKSILAEFKIGESTLYRIIKEKEHLIEKFNHSVSGSMHPYRPSEEALASAQAGAKKHKVISLEDKVKIIKRLEENVPRTSILNEFKIGESTLYRIIKDKDTLLKKFYESWPPMYNQYANVEEPPAPPRERGPKKHKVISLEDKVKIIKRVEDNLPRKSILAEFQIGESTLYRIIKDKDQLIKRFYESWQSNAYGGANGEYGGPGGGPGSNGKKQHKVIALEDKIQIIKRLDENMPKSAILREFNIGESTLYRIIKNKGRLLERFQAEANGHR